MIRLCKVVQSALMACACLFLTLGALTYFSSPARAGGPPPAPPVCVGACNCNGLPLGAICNSNACVPAPPQCSCSNSRCVPNAPNGVVCAQVNCT